MKSASEAHTVSSVTNTDVASTSTSVSARSLFSARGRWCDISGSMASTAT